MPKGIYACVHFGFCEVLLVCVLCVCVCLSVFQLRLALIIVQSFRSFRLHGQTCRSLIGSESFFHNVEENKIKKCVFH